MVIVDEADWNVEFEMLIHVKITFQVVEPLNCDMPCV